MNSKLFGVLVLACSVSACSTLRKSGGEIAVAPLSVAQVHEEIGQAKAKVAEETGGEIVVNEPTLVPFKKMGAKLSPGTEQQVRSLAPALAIARQITVTGYCNRAEVGNAVAGAKARAELVKKILVESGIAAERIVIKIETKTTLHAVRISFSG